MLESRLRVALQNSKHSFDSECPLFTPDDAQNLLLGYAEEARSEESSTGNCIFVTYESVNVMMKLRQVGMEMKVSSIVLTREVCESVNSLMLFHIYLINKY